MTLQRVEPPKDVEERLRRYERTADFAALWPRVERSAVARAQAVIERIVRCVLGMREPERLDATNVAELDALRLAAYLGGTGPLLGRWMEEGRVRATDAVSELFQRELQAGRERMARITRGVLPLFDALIARGITPVVLKGFHTAHALHEEPGVRPIADVDVLVPPDRVVDAEEALAAVGFVATQPHPGAAVYKRHWRACDVDARHWCIDGVDPRNPWEVDLHVSWDRAMYGSCVTLDGVGELVPLVIEGRALLAPGHPLLLLVLAAQASEALMGLRLMRILEVVRAARDARPALSWATADEATRANGAGRFIYPALALADQLAPGCIDPGLLRYTRSAAPRLARLAVPRLAPGGGIPGDTAFALQLLFTASTREAARIVLSRIATHASRGPRDVLQTVMRLVRPVDRGLRFLPRRERA